MLVDIHNNNPPRPSSAPPPYLAFELIQLRAVEKRISPGAMVVTLVEPFAFYPHSYIEIDGYAIDSRSLSVKARLKRTRLVRNTSSCPMCVLGCEGSTFGTQMIQRFHVEESKTPLQCLLWV
ncbi:hypothetical protein PV325_006994 [Microctonus aethiopoides]|nr:hypothetical protein PV325_006994 [Microctonus aethiopoides]